MDYDKLIEQLKDLEECAYGYHINGEILGMDYSDFEQLMVDAAEEIYKVSTLQAENKKLRAENIRWGQVASEQDKQLDKLQTALEQVKQCIEIVETQRDAAIKELENYMVQDTLDGNKPCEICSKVSDTSCKYYNPKWRGPV